jgi:hypothetical protein
LTGKPASLEFSTRACAAESQIGKLLCRMTGLEQHVLATSLSPFPSATHVRDRLSQERADALNASAIGIEMQAIRMDQSLNRHPTSKRTKSIKVLIQKIIILRQTSLTIEQATSREPHFAKTQLR